MLNQKAAFLMENYGDEIRAATKSKKPTTEAILDWVCTYKSVPVGDIQGILFLQRQLQEAMLQSSSHQQILKELKQHELKDQKQIIPEKTTTLQTELPKKAQPSLPIDPKILKESELIRKEKEFAESEQALMQREKQLAQREHLLMQKEREVVEKEIAFTKREREPKKQTEETNSNLRTGLTKK